MTAETADLIERLTKATWPDRELDCLIWAAINDHDVRYDSNGSVVAIPRPRPTKEFRIGFIDHGMVERNFYTAGYPSSATPTYTASLDAALTLVPEGLYWLVSEGRTRETEPLGGAQVFRPSYLVKPLAEAEHESAVIALVIVALKARAALA